MQTLENLCIKTIIVDKLNYSKLHSELREKIKDYEIKYNCQNLVSIMIDLENFTKEDEDGNHVFVLNIDKSIKYANYCVRLRLFESKKLNAYIEYLLVYRLSIHKVLLKKIDQINM